LGNLVFLDSSGLIAYVVARDPDHRRAVGEFRRLLEAGGHFFTTNYVFDEVVTRVRRRAGYLASRRVGNDVLRSRVITRVFIDEELESRAWRLYEKYHDHELSFTDASSFAVMDRAGVREALTFDGDFRRVGYTMLPRP
jgi:hypothetical protein